MAPRDGPDSEGNVRFPLQSAVGDQVEITQAMIEAGESALYRAVGFQVPDGIQVGIEAVLRAALPLYLLREGQK